MNACTHAFYAMRAVTAHTIFLMRPSTCPCVCQLGCCCYASTHTSDGTVDAQPYAWPASGCEVLITGVVCIHYEVNVHNAVYVTALDGTL